MDNKIMILKRDCSDVFFKYENVSNIYSYYSVNINNIILKITKKMGIFLPILYGKWVNEINEYNRIIFFDNAFSDVIAKYIKKKYPNKKTFFWYWNPITEYSCKFLNNKFIDEFFTYSKSDAINYNINYINQFYSDKIKLSKNKLLTDILFLGMAKNRKKEILKFEKECSNNNLLTNFIIVEKKEEYISYDDYLNMISKSKCIVEYTDDNNLTLRTVESIFFKKKLITNNKDIVNYDFYNKNNVFIIGLDNIKKLGEFVNSEYEKNQNHIMENYNFENWCGNFK